MAAFALIVLARAVVLLAAAWIAASLARRRPAALRAGIWTAALTGLVLLPLASRITPAWRVPVLPAVPQAVQTQTDRREPAAAAATPAADIAPPISTRAQASVLPDLVAVKASPIAPGSNATTKSAENPRLALSTAEMILLAWLAVTIGLLARLAVSYRRTSRALHDATTTAADSRWLAIIEATRADLSITRGVRVVLTDAVAVPAISGVVRPSLMLPIDAGEWTDDACRVVALHELAHVARWDAVGQIAGQIACALYWFLPPVWMGARRATALREQATDDVVLGTGVRASTYAANLIELARRCAEGTAVATTLAMASPEQVHRRVEAILDPTAPRRRLTIGAAISLAIVTTAAVTTIAAASPVPQDQWPTPPPPPPPASTVPPLPPPPPPPEAMPDLPLAPPTATPTPPTPPSPPTPEVAATQMPAPPPPPPPPVYAMPPTPPPAPPMRPVYAPTPAPPPPPPARATPPPPPPPAPPAPASVSALCGSDTKSSSQSMNTDGNRQTWTVKISAPSCDVDLRADGRVTFNADFTDISSLSSRGMFRLSVLRDGVRHELTITEHNGTLARTWKVDDKEQPYDAAAQRWFAAFLLDLDRQTAIGVDVRLPMLLKQGGVAAVLRETAQMPGDYARSVYFGKLAGATSLSAANVTAILDQVISMGTGDYCAEQILSHVAASRAGDPAVHAAALRVLDGMKSDYYIAEGTRAVIGSRPAPADVEFLLRAAVHMSSDFYRLQMIEHVTKGGTLSAPQRGELARITAGMHDDYYTSNVIRLVAGDGGLDASSRRTLLDATRRMHNDNYKLDAVRVMLADPGVREADLLDLVELTRGMGSDFYKAEALRAIAGHSAASARVNDAVISAADGLPDYYRTSVRRAVRAR